MILQTYGLNEFTIEHAFVAFNCTQYDVKLQIMLVGQLEARKQGVRVSYFITPLNTQLLVAS